MGEGIHHCVVSFIVCAFDILLRQFSHESRFDIAMKNCNSSAESKKGTNAVQKCSVQNQKGAIARLCTAIASFWFSMEHLWTVLRFCDIWITQCTHERKDEAEFAVSHYRAGRRGAASVWVPCQSNMHGACVSCASVHMQRAVYRQKWLEGHLALPAK